MVLLCAVGAAVALFILPSAAWWQPVLFSYTFVIVGAYLLISPIAGTVSLIFGTVLYVLALFKSLSGELSMPAVITGLVIMYICYFIVKKVGDTSSYMLLNAQDTLKSLEGDFAAMIIEKKNLEAGLESNRTKLQKYEKLKVIYEELKPIPDFSGKARHLLKNVIEMFHQEKSIVLFLTRDNKVMKVVADKKDDFLIGERDIESLYLKNFDEFILHNKKSIIITDMAKEIRFKSDGDEDIRALISVPVFAGDDVAGILRVSSSESGCFNQEDLRFLDIIGGIVGKILMEEKYVE
jgi:putative methionine-R-sulfoxide reductase with GAF domain